MRNLNVEINKIRDTQSAIEEGIRDILVYLNENSHVLSEELKTSLPELKALELTRCGYDEHFRLEYGDVYSILVANSSFSIEKNKKTIFIFCWRDGDLAFKGYNLFEKLGCDATLSPIGGCSFNPFKTLNEVYRDALRTRLAFAGIGFANFTVGDDY